MASSRDQYETRLVRRAKDARKLARQGWEIVSTSGKEGGIMGSNLQIVLRRPNPNYVDPETRAEERNRILAERDKRKQKRRQERTERAAQKEEEREGRTAGAEAPTQTVATPPHAGPANWYPDPNGTTGLLRYWDGSAWTEHTHEQPGTQTAAGLPPDEQPPKKSWYRRWWVWAIAGIFFLVWIGSLIDQSEDENVAVEATPTVTEASEPPSATPTTPEPTPEQETTTAAEPEPTEEESPALSDDEALAAVDDYLGERAADGVLLAEAVSETSLSDGLLTVVFDPEGAGYERDFFEEMNPFDNLAEFVGTPFCFANDEGARIRTRITDVATEYPNGESLGSATVAELYELCTGEQLDE